MAAQGYFLSLFPVCVTKRFSTLIGEYVSESLPLLKAFWMSTGASDTPDRLRLDSRPTDRQYTKDGQSIDVSGPTLQFRRTLIFGRATSTGITYDVRSIP